MARYEWNSKYILKIDNTSLAVDLADMKKYLKVDNTADDILIESLIRTATSMAERYTRREFLTKTFDMFLDFFPFFKLYGNTVEGNFDSNTILVKRSKLSLIGSIQFFNNGVLETLDNTLYDFTQDNDYSRIFLIDQNSSWPDTDDRKQAVVIEFDVGYGPTNSSIPEQLKTAIKMIVAYVYENRGDCPASNLISQIAQSGMISIAGAEFLVDQFKILEI